MIYLFGLLLILAIFGGLIWLAIKAFKFSFDGSHGWLWRIIAFAVACTIVFELFGR